MNSAIIVAAGASRRMGFDKLFTTLGDRPVIAHTLQAFQSSPVINEIIVVTHPDRFEAIEKLQTDHGLDQITALIAGGRERHESVLNGLNALNEACDYVAIHDGARPLISQQDIAACMKIAKEHRAAACARRITETVKRADGNHRVTGSVDRTNLWAMQTPQIFERQLILDAYEAVSSKNLLVTDEVSAVEHFGESVILSQSHHPNLKITFPQDIDLATQLLPYQSNAQITGTRIL
ncbi:MAG: 2-C-methyl-D-erythritol 4-phosphate cytidylyltransferase [Verrucomicrobiota bacterium]